MKATGLFEGLIAALAALALLVAPGAARAQTQGVTDTEILLGTDQDLSGPVAVWGVPLKNGMEMAVEDLNAAGGIHGRRLRLIVEDMGYDPRKAVLATEKLLSRDKVFAIVGAFGTTTTAATMPLVLKRGIPHLFPISPAEMFAVPFHRLKFAFFTPYYDDVRTSVKYMLATKKVTKVGVLYQDDDFGAEILKAVQDQLQTVGMKPVSVTSFKRGATDFSSQIARLRADGAELVVMGTIVRETIGAMTVARNLGWKPDFLVSQGGYSVAVAALGKDVVEGLYGAAVTPISYPDTAAPALREWMQRYKSRYNVEPTLEAMVGYMVLEATSLGLKNAGRELTVDSFVTGMEKIRAHRNIFGMIPYSFTPDNHLTTRRSHLAQIQQGRWVLLTDSLHYGD